VSSTAPKRQRLTPERRRDLILEGAERVFAERGYEAASMEEIARAAGITPAVIYDHFPSKAQLHVQLLEGQAAALIDSVAAALVAAPDEPGERLRIGIDAYFGFVERHRFAWRMLIREPPSDATIAAAYLQLEHEATAAIAAFIEAGAPGALDGFPDRERASEMFAETLKGAQNGLAAWWYEHPEVPRAEVVERMIDFCWLGLERTAEARTGGEG
jgi:AcrR family transcriptional regulator